MQIFPTIITIHLFSVTLIYFWFLTNTIRNLILIYRTLCVYSLVYPTIVFCFEPFLLLQIILWILENDCCYLITKLLQFMHFFKNSTNFLSYKGLKQQNICTTFVFRSKIFGLFCTYSYLCKRSSARCSSVNAGVTFVGKI